MRQQATIPANRTLWQAFSGILFPVFFLLGDIVRGRLAISELPLPNAPVEESARYVIANQSAVLAVAGVQILSAVALFFFVGALVFQIWKAGNRNRAAVIGRVGGVLAALFLLLSALLSLVLLIVANAENLTWVGIVRDLNFRTGGTLHVTTLGIFVGAVSLAARRIQALPGWINWLGLVQATLAILSLLSFFSFYASLFILAGRMLGFVWSIAVGIVLLVGKWQQPVTGGDRHVLA